MIKSVSLQDFRNFETKELSLSSGLSVVLGPNGVGKTNLLESIFLLVTGKSFKARVEEEMINHKADIARVEGVVGDGEDEGLTVVLTRGEIGGRRVGRKRLLVDNAGKRLVDFAGRQKVVLFSPMDMELVLGSPSVRRNFLDVVLFQVDREYRRAIGSYEKGLRRRNKLLYRIREEGVLRGQLLFWNNLLVKNGEYITVRREEFIEWINGDGVLGDKGFRLEYDKSVISPARLEQYRNEEVAAATTLVGPHRDDIQFKIQNSKFKIDRNLNTYGSRGEQRMGVLWLKMRELKFMEERTSEKSILLLDDIFSELDEAHRRVVLEVVVGRQVIITTADPSFADDFREARVVNLGV